MDNADRLRLLLSEFNIEAQIREGRIILPIEQAALLVSQGEIVAQVIDSDLSVETPDGQAFVILPKSKKPIPRTVSDREVEDAIRGSADPMAFCTLAGYCLYENKALADFSGVPQHEWRGYFSRQHWLDGEFNKILPILAQGGSQQADYSAIRRKAGDLAVVSAEFKPTTYLGRPGYIWRGISVSPV